MALNEKNEALQRLEARRAQLLAELGIDPEDPGLHSIEAQPWEPANSAGEPTHSEDGVDLTLIRWMLSLTPLQRLQMAQQFATSIARLRGERSDV